jgi:hypothetical protein
MSDDMDVMAVYGRSVTLLGDDWLSRRAERSFEAAQRVLDDWHRFMGGTHRSALGRPDGMPGHHPRTAQLPTR